jgi:hypothetical protein
MNVSIPLELAQQLPQWSTLDYATGQLAAAGLPPHKRQAILLVFSLLHTPIDVDVVPLPIDPLAKPLIISAAVSIAPNKEDLIRTLALLF